MDSLGHVNNAQYFRYMEQARVAWLASIGLFMGHERQGAVIVTASCTFLKPIVYPATLEVSVDGGAPGRSSVPVYQDISVIGDPPVKCAEGETKVVWIDYDTGKSIPLPDELRKLLED
jgi:acyl-CoA thioester hydrolase